MTTTTTPKLWRDCMVTMIGHMNFLPPAHMPVNWAGEASDPERLLEFSGRMCYMSQHNPANRTNKEYIENILDGGHGSVTEHAVYSLLIEGVSRTLTHELVRHRAGMAYSELSQRFVNMEQASFVIPPLILGDEVQEAALLRQITDSLGKYEELAESLIARFEREGLYADDRTLRRKRAREAARSALPNCTETKIVATGNARAWRHIIELRGNVGADAEIVRLARSVHNILYNHSPNLFGDFRYAEDMSLVPRYHKV